MSPTLSFLLGLTTLIPQTFSITIPANPSLGLANAITVDTTADNPLPPSPPGGWYNIPGTSLSIKALPPFGPTLPSLPSALTCLAAARSNISATIAAKGDLPLPRPTWQFASANLNLAASSPFPNLATYGRLSSALAGLRHLITVPGGPGAVQMAWVLVDDVLGIVMNGAIASDAGGGHGLAGGTMVSEGVSVTVASATVTASAMASQSLGIVAVEELDST